MATVMTMSTIMRTMVSLDKVPSRPGTIINRPGWLRDRLKTLPCRSSDAAFRASGAHVLSYAPLRFSKSTPYDSAGRIIKRSPRDRSATHLSDRDMSMDRDTRNSAIAALVILALFFAFAYYLPAIMLTVGKVSSLL